MMSWFNKRRSLYLALIEHVPDEVARTALINELVARFAGSDDLGPAMAALRDLDSYAATER